MKSPINPSIAETEAEAARGETVPLAPILKRLHETADRLEAKAADTHTRRTAYRI